MPAVSSIAQSRMGVAVYLQFFQVVSLAQRFCGLPDDFDRMHPGFYAYLAKCYLLFKYLGIPFSAPHLALLMNLGPRQTQLVTLALQRHLQFLLEQRSIERPNKYKRRKRLGERVWEKIIRGPSDKAFKRNARMSKETFVKLYLIIRDDPIFVNKSRNPQEHAAYQLYVTLVRLGRRGNGMSYGEVGEKLDISAGTSVLYTLRCLEALHRCLLAKGYLKWPDATEREKIARAFGQVSPFARLVGLMDGTQIEVEYIPGRDDALLWYGRKNKYGFNVLIIVDHECCIRYIHTGFTASCHDQRVYNSTRIYQHPHEFFSDKEYLLADSGFTPNDNCVPSYKRTASRRGGNNALSRAQTEFNNSVKKVRVDVERTIGYWKARFQSLKLLSPQIKSADHHVIRATIWIQACHIAFKVTAMLHNFILEHEGLEALADEDIFSQAELQEILREEQRRQREMADEASALLTPEERRGPDRRRKEVQREVEVVNGWGQATIYGDR
ncbi:hypothetical protein D1P53_005642 [Cryptococcus gattii VGV]|nr:hypothetical protein D1P53_005642 [Cryptococcus gattii VGV]